MKKIMVLIMTTLLIGGVSVSAFARGSHQFVSNHGGNFHGAAHSFHGGYSHGNFNHGNFNHFAGRGRVYGNGGYYNGGYDDYCSGYPYWNGVGPRHILRSLLDGTLDGC